MPTGKTNNVLALPANRLPALAVAATAGEGAAVTGTRNELWLFRAYTEGHPVKLYVKLGQNNRALLVEALCAQLAQCLGVSAATPYLVLVNPRHAGRPKGPVEVAFGVKDISARSLAKPIMSLDLLFNVLERQRLTDLACTVDEWTGNQLRSPSDILVGSDSNLYLMDHDGAMADQMLPARATANWLADRLMVNTPKSERAQFLRRLRGRMAALHRLQLTDVPESVSFAEDGPTIYAELLQFLHTRLGYLDQLISQRVHPEQGYLTPPPPAAPRHKNAPN